MKPNPRTQVRCLLVAASLGALTSLAAHAQTAWSPEQARAMQRQQADRLLQLRDDYRRTHDISPHRAEVSLIHADLVRSNESLHGAQDRAAFARGWLLRGDAQRLLDDSKTAAAAYAEAARAAKEAQDAATEAEALASKAAEEMALLNFTQAGTDAQRALAIARPAGQHAAASSALGTQVDLLLVREQWQPALLTSQHSLDEAALADDPMALFRAHLRRSFVLSQRGGNRCDLLGDVRPCIEELDAALKHIDAARPAAQAMQSPAKLRQLDAYRAAVLKLRQFLDKRDPLS